MEKIFIGIDMGATHIRICVMDTRSEVLITERRKTQEIIGADFIQGMINFCQEFIADNNVANIVIGLPAAISFERQKVLSVPNLSLSQQDLDNLAPALSMCFNCPVSLERDVNLQMIYDVNHFGLQDKLALGVYLGTGVGFSIWFQGKLFIGAHGVAGELGHIPYGDKYNQCGCGNHGCLETTCSGVVLKNWYEKQDPDYPIDLIFTHAGETDFIQAFLVKLANAIATTVNLFDPDALILGGGVMDMQDFPISYLESLVRKHMRKPLPHNALKILRAQSSSFNGAIGAALYARQHYIN